MAFPIPLPEIIVLLADKYVTDHSLVISMHESKSTHHHKTIITAEILRWKNQYCYVEKWDNNQKTWNA